MMNRAITEVAKRKKNRGERDPYEEKKKTKVKIGHVKHMRFFCHSYFIKIPISTYCNIITKLIFAHLDKTNEL